MTAYHVADDALHVDGFVVVELGDQFLDGECDRVPVDARELARVHDEDDEVGKLNRLRSVLAARRVDVVVLLVLGLCASVSVWPR